MGDFLNLAANWLEHGRPAAPVCRYHSVHCEMGRNWPLPYVHGNEDELVEMVTAAHRACGRETEPTRRERWEVHVHELVPAAEIEQRERELAELIADLQQKNAAIEAELRGERQ